MTTAPAFLFSLEPHYVSDATAATTADALVGAPVDSPAARAFAAAPKRRAKKATAAASLADAASFLGLTCEAGRAANAAREAAAAEPAAAFPSMLPDRSWGASVEGETIAVGARIRVTTRGGKSWLATVTEVHFARAGRTIVTATGDDPPEARERSSSRGKSRGGGRSRHASIAGRDYFQNARGRCEDAPCCGCCT